MDEAGLKGWNELRVQIEALMRERYFVWLLLALILVMGAYFRFVGLNWDEDQHLHPDERFLTMVETSIALPRSLGEYFDSTTSPLNPYNRGYSTFVYGTLPLFLTRFVAQMVHKTEYWNVHLVGRALSALFDLGSLILIFLMGRKLYDSRVGLLSAALLALAVSPIQQSHFFTVDTFANFFVVAALYFAVHVTEEGQWWQYGLLGASLGMAVACKINVATLAAIVVLAAAVHLYTVLRRGTTAQAGSEAVAEAAVPSREDAFALERTVVRLIFALTVAGITFRVLQPYAFQGPSFLNFSFDRRWLDNMKYIRDLISGAIDYPPSHQWANRTAFVYPWRNMVLWGMGVPLGLTAWAGWALALVQILKGRWRQHLLPWTWVTLTFLYQGPQFVKTMRYFLPIYPFIIMLGAYLLISLLDWGEREASRQGISRQGTSRQGTRKGVVPVHLFPCLLVSLVLFSTFLWAFAFTRIYTRPHSRIQASRWIYAHIPAGATLAYELWDDPLPLGVDGKSFGDTYNSVEMKPYDDDNEDKRRALIDWLDQTDYVILSSNRLYASIPRLPMRYPLTTEYYRLLFAEQLGFKLAKVVTSYPNLGPLQFNDDGADEAFTVYDHPKVLIFQKTEDFSRARVEELLGRVSLDNVLRLTPKQAMAAPTGLMLSPQEWEAQRRGGTWSAMFNRESPLNRHGWLALLVWWLAVELLGLVAFPIAFLVFRNLYDRGYVLTKVLGLLLVAYLAWLAASLRLLPYTRLTILLALALVALLAVYLAWRRWEGLVAFWREKRRLILLNEALFLIFFLAFFLIRLANPDLWHPVTGGEKPMDLAYLNAVMKSTYFPPYDPWFAGGYINYYYFGFVLVGSLIKLTGIVPWVAYNLTIPLLFALTAMGAFCVVYNLVQSPKSKVRSPTSNLQPPTSNLQRQAVGYGLLGALFVAVIGNLGEVKLILEGLWQVSGSQFRSTIPGLAGAVKALLGLSKVLLGNQALPFRIEWWYWNPTRVIPETINEFPFFTFLYADLHAHAVALPLTLLVLAMAVNVARERRELSNCANVLCTFSFNPGDFLGLLIFALALGALRPTNTWDYPTYLLIALGALAIREYRRRGQVDRAGLWAVTWRFGAIVVLSTLLFWPYQARYAAAYTSLELWKGSRTGLMDYLIVHGFFLFVLVTFLGVETWQWLNQEGGAWREWLRAWSPLAPYVGVPVALLALLLVLKHLWLFLFLLPLLGLTAFLFLREAPPEKRFVLGLILVGLALSLGVEVVVLKGDIGRMNTVFKFYLQIWVLWGVATAASLAWLVNEVRRWSFQPRRLWTGALIALFLCTALYPVFATRAKVRDRFDPRIGPTIDGRAYMRQATYHDQQPLTLYWDYEAINWLLDNVQGSPVILEANTVEYRWGSRVSIYTGLPSVVGWSWHQRQQRAVLPGGQVERRIEEVRTIYNTTDVNQALALLRKYHVAYIYVGELERAYYEPAGLAKFDAMVGRELDLAYQSEAVKIYRVKGEGGWGEMEGGRGRFVHSPSSTLRLPSSTLHSPRLDLMAKLPLSSDFSCLDDPPPQGKSLLLDVPVDQLPVVDDRGWNPLANVHPLLSIATWWAVVQVLGLAAWPLAFLVFRSFADRGYILAKTLGLLVVAYLVWVSASLRLLPNTVPTARLAFSLLLALSLLSFWRHRGEMAALWRQKRSLILIQEGLFSLAFLFFVGLRILNPDLWQPWFGGEKFMEFAFLNAILKSAHFPPYDPYFAGGYINYYYYGQFIVALLVKLTGIVPQVAFNLAVPTLFALTVGNSFSLGHNLGGGYVSGLAGALFVAVLGNLDGLVQVVGKIAPAILQGQAPPPFDYWHSTRIIPHTINEFPFFSFLFADLHPHMIGIPFTVFVLALLFNLVRKGRSGDQGMRALRGLRETLSVPSARALLVTRSAMNARNEQPGCRTEGGAGSPALRGQSPFGADESSSMSADETSSKSFALSARWLQPRALLRRNSNFLPYFDHTPLDTILLSLSLGAVAVINTWDFPTYLVLLFLALLLRRRASEGRRGWLILIVSFLLIAAASLLLYWPFYTHYQALKVGVGLVREQTGLPDFLTMWGFFLFAVVTYLLVELLRSREWRGLLRFWRLLRRHRDRASRVVRLYRALVRRPAKGERLAVSAALVVLLTTAGLALWSMYSTGLALAGQGVPALLVPLVAGAAFLLLRRNAAPEERFTALLIFMGLAILLGCEVIFLRDFLEGGEWYRMNTVFKFYIQAWVLLGLGTAAALPHLGADLGGLSGTLPDRRRCLERFLSLKKGAMKTSEVLQNRAPAGLRALWVGIFLFLLLSCALYPLLGTPARVTERFPGERPPLGTLDGMAFMAVGSYTWPEENRIELKYDYQAIQWLLTHVKGTPVIAEASLPYYREGGMRVASFTGLPTLLGAHQSEQRYAWQVGPRAKAVQEFFDTSSIVRALALIEEHRISYIYVGQLEQAVYDPEGLAKFEQMREGGYLDLVYENERVKIYRVRG